MEFRVHYITQDGENKSKDVTADTPLAAANIIRKTIVGTIVKKTKRLR